MCDGNPACTGESEPARTLPGKMHGARIGGGPGNRIQAVDAPNPLRKQSFRRHAEGIHKEIYTDHFIGF